MIVLCVVLLANTFLKSLGKQEGGSINIKENNIKSDWCADSYSQCKQYCYNGVCDASYCCWDRSQGKNSTLLKDFRGNININDMEN